MEEGLAPTDSRLRPDQRLMEEGKWDDANDEKLRLEEKQRAARRQRELESELAVQEGNGLFDILLEMLCSICTNFLLQVVPCLPTIRSGSERRRTHLRAT